MAFCTLKIIGVFCFTCSYTVLEIKENKRYYKTYHKSLLTLKKAKLNQTVIQTNITSKGARPSSQKKKKKNIHTSSTFDAFSDLLFVSSSTGGTLASTDKASASASNLLSFSSNSFLSLVSIVTSV